MSDLITAQTPTADHVRLALSLMADGAHMVLSGVPDDPSLATYSFPGHISKALHAQLADAQAAVALVVEQAGLAVANTEIGFHDGISGDWHPMDGPSIISACCAAIRDLAPIDGLALVRELRAERDALFRRAALAEEWRDHDKARAEKAEAELAAAKQREAGLVTLMPEVLAALDANGCNISLVRDIRAALTTGENDD